MGAAGTTPTTDVGAIGEDGITLELTSEKRDILQGNPQTIEESFSVKQGVKLTINLIEWNFDNIGLGLGSGSTQHSGTLQTFTLGGIPSVQKVALQVEHVSPAGQTFYHRIWRARGDGSMSIQMGNEEHKFPHAFQAMRSATNWAGASLPSSDQLLQIVRIS